VTPDEYLQDVGYRLIDLPWSMRRDLLAELRSHLDELPAETDLRSRLGAPEQYAAYLPADTKGSPAGDSEYVVYREGRSFRFGITIQNTGRFTVRVLGVAYPAVFPFSARLLMSTPAPPSKLHVFPGPLAAFHPFDLHPGEISSLILKGVYACHSGEGPGNSWTLDPVPVRYSFLWRTATTSIPLHSRLAITLPDGCDIPGGTP
jgi:hypothetical protein